MDVVNYQCPNCTAPLKFSSGSQQWDCEFCGSAFQLSDLQEQAAKADTVEGGTYDPSENEWREGELEGMRVYSCDKCGGEIIADDTTSASFCPYCGNTAIFPKQFEGAFRPELVIPFQTDKKQAQAAYRNLCKGKWLIPKDFVSANKIEKITGVYVPFWLYDCDSDASLAFNATKVKHWTSGSYSYTKTDYYAVFRDGAMSFEKVPADGSTKMDNTLMGAIEPYDYSQAVDFTTAYLSGYLAEKYDQTADDMKPEVDRRMRGSTSDLLKKTVNGYSSVIQTQGNINLKYGKTRYVLLPVWLLVSKYNGKDYVFAMNGQTGKLIGDLPVSMKRACGFFFGIMGSVTAICYIFSVIANFLGGM